MKEHRFYDLKLASVCLVLSMATTLVAAEPNNIADILKTNGFDWLIGQWDTITDSNEKAHAEFNFILDGFALSTKAKVGRSEYEGLAYFVPHKNTIINTGVDNDGRTFGGTWEIQGDKLVLKLQQTNPDGAINNFIRFLSNVDADTMKSITYRVIDGRRSDEPLNILEFKRRK